MKHSSFPIERFEPYVGAELAELVLEARLDGRDVIDLSQFNPDIAPPAEATDRLVQAVLRPENHRYSASKGIYRLRKVISDFYQKHFSVSLDVQSECSVCMGAKEGIFHLLQAISKQGDRVILLAPVYPVHKAAASFSQADTVEVPFLCESFWENLEQQMRVSCSGNKFAILSFPNNPTSHTVDLDFFEKLLQLAKKNGVFLIHDFSYHGISYQEYQAPSILQVEGAKECAVEVYSMSKNFSAAGWRVGFCVGNSELIAALSRLKSYVDFGIFQPLQIAACEALIRAETYWEELSFRYQARRDLLYTWLEEGGWQVEKPRSTVFLWAKLPDNLLPYGSLAFCKELLKQTNTAACAGINFGQFGEDFVRFCLAEPESRIAEAIGRINKSKLFV